jgi:hypothetical protein
MNRRPLPPTLIDSAPMALFVLAFLGFVAMPLAIHVIARIAERLRDPVVVALLP